MGLGVGWLAGCQKLDVIILALYWLEPLLEAIEFLPMRSLKRLYLIKVPEINLKLQPRA